VNLPAVLQDKWSRLLNLLGSMDGAVIAFSGGVDSTLLLAAGAQALGDRCLAVMGISPSYPREQQRQARELASQLGVTPRMVNTDEMSDADYLSNPEDRCFHCKKHLFGKLSEIAVEEGAEWVLDGSNADDLSDYRPGFRAGREANVRSPMVEVGMTKAEIREVLRQLELPVWDQPAQPCLASRIPYGHEITADKLSRIERSEHAVRALGFTVVRVRDWGHLAVVEVGPEQLEELFEAECRSRVVEALKKAGYKRVALDSQGYRLGSLNEAIKK
jgi:pyridinium-3,5-biscarboxylic acid mononucleotide sulfurtransferase